MLHGRAAFACLAVAVAAQLGTAMVESGRAYCWGYNNHGQRGDNTTSDSTVPAAVSGGLAFTHLDAGLFHTCGIQAGSKAAWHWGNVPTDNTVVPVAASGGLAFTHLTSGDHFICGIQAGSGAAWCWGHGALGRLGNGAIFDSKVPVAVSGGLAFTHLTAGARGCHTCGIQAGSGAVWCWGYNNLGQLGFDWPAVDFSTVPLAVPGGLAFTHLVAGDAHNCGIRAGSGATWCWGNNWNGQLGNGATSDSAVPVAVAGGLAFTYLTAGLKFTCGIQAGSGAAWCWGSGQYGQLGNGTTSDSAVPVAVAGGLAFTYLTAGRDHTCGIQAGSGAAWCWGLGEYGQLGNSATSDSAVPVAVAGGLAFTDLAAGGDHTCGIQEASPRPPPKPSPPPLPKKPDLVAFTRQARDGTIKVKGFDGTLISLGTHQAGKAVLLLGSAEQRFDLTVVFGKEAPYGWRSSSGSSHRPCLKARLVALCNGKAVARAKLAQSGTHAWRLVDAVKGTAVPGTSARSVPARRGKPGTAVISAGWVEVTATQPWEEHAGRHADYLTLKIRVPEAGRLQLPVTGLLAPSYKRAVR